MARNSINRYTLILLFLLFPFNSWSAPPSRSFTYTAGNIISPSEVTSNEDNVFNYLTSGVDTYADNSIVNADINSSAAITYSKLNLSASILTGDIKDAEIVNADISASAAIAGSKLVLTGITTFTAGGDLDIGPYELRAQTLESDVTTGTAPLTVASTTKVTNLNADTLDGSDSTAFSQKQLFTSSDTFTAPSGVTKVYVTMVGGGGGGGGGGTLTDAGGGGGGAGEYIIREIFTVVGGNNYSVSVGAAGVGGAGGNPGGVNGTAGGDSAWDTGGVNFVVTGGSGGVKGISGTGGTGGSSPSANSINASGQTGGGQSSYAGGNSANGVGSGTGTGGGGGGGVSAGANGMLGFVLVEY